MINRWMGDIALVIQAKTGVTSVTMNPNRAQAPLYGFNKIDALAVSPWGDTPAVQ